MKKRMLIPAKASAFLALPAIFIALIVYMLVIPFDLVFSYKDHEIYRQESVGVLNNFEKASADDEGTMGWDSVYGEDNVEFITYDGEERCNFKNNYGTVKKMMLRRSLKNLFTFAWGEEDFVIEFTAE